MRNFKLPFLTNLIIAASFTAACSLPAAALACGAVGTGNPANCASDQPAAQSTNLPGTQASNPIEIVTGNKYQHETDLAPLPGALGLQWDRHYNSRSEYEGALGFGWSHAYEAVLFRGSDALIQIRQADGRLIFFRRAGKAFVAALPGDGRVDIIGDQYRWTWRDGRKLTFDDKGRLTAIQTAAGEAVFLTYDHQGRLIGLTDPQKRALSIAYDDRAKNPEQRRLIRSVTGPAGKTSYAYDDWNNLVEARYPDGTSRRYLYDDDYDAHNLTGIVDRSGQRYGTYAYDGQDRAILSTHAADVEKVTLRFEHPAAHDGSAPGRTVLTNSRGHQTVYETRILNRVPVIIEARGPGCSTCAETNVRYAYTKSGQLESQTKLDAQGRPTQTIRTEYDAQGRPLRLAKQGYANGKPTPAALLQRFEYQGDNPNPSLIAGPSVVPGREHRIDIEYGTTEATRVQPVKVTESGYSPLSAEGKPDPANPTPITRSTSYRYDDKGRLAAIDGPLPGSADTTGLEYNDQGQIVRIRYPGNLAATLRYDTLGRVIEAFSADGSPVRYAYNDAGAVSAVTRAGTTQAYRYDVLGHLTEAGTLRGNTFKPEARYGYDGAGRLAWQAEALGILKRVSYDTEGNLLSSTVQTRSFEQTERYRYDEFSRLVQVADNTGSVRNVAYGEARPRAASAFRTLKDDFGREVMVTGPSHGTLIKRYDAADRLIGQNNDKGDAQTWAYDLTGQRIGHTVTPKNGAPQTTAWRYEHGRPVEISDPNQSEHTSYNERGQPTERTVTLKLANGAEATHVTRYAYNADGSLQSQSLPDGTRIEYERNGQGQVVALHRQTSPWTLFGRGRQTLVKDLERDLIGLRQATYGNGIRGQWQRSKEGVLARVVYSHPADAPALGAGSAQARINPVLDELLGALLPAAHAQPAPPPPEKRPDGLSLPGALGIPSDPRALFDARLLYDGAGNVLLQKSQGQGVQATQAYAYDGRHQLIAAQSASQPSTSKTAAGTSEAIVWRYHYDRQGNRVLAQEQVPVAEMGQTRKTAYDPESQSVSTPSGREYVWDAQGRLVGIRQDNKDLAHYRYDHRGLRIGKQVGAQSAYTLYNDQRQRIADLNAEGRITRQYLWLADQLIATVDTMRPKELRAPADGFLAELAQAAHALWDGVTGNADRIAFVHVNHLSAPIAATDEAGQTIWQADYAPYGKLIKASTSPGKAAYTLALRYPGQWEDDESGLYYNDARYYDPQAGRYLSPDPLGRLAEALGSPNAYSYVNNNPLSYIDPWGLILFAFDGTGNTEESRTNVYWFREYYLDNDPELASVKADKPFYIEGPGTGPILPKTDGAIAFTMRSRINTQLKRLDDYVEAKVDNVLNVKKQEISRVNPLVITLDIVGFSRGSASARDFANTVVTRAKSGYYRNLDGVNGKCVAVKIRFMGLFDTVLSYALGSFNMGIPEAVKYASQAVAVNEHRHDFPVESIEPSYADRGLSSNRTERGFVGAHSDIGGGYNCVGGADAGCDGGDLSDVALNWMVAEAERAGVNMAPLPDELRTITNPILHNETRSIPFNLRGAGQDREVRYPVSVDAPNPLPKQRNAPIEGLTWSDSLTWITPDAAPSGSREGTVDMSAYGAWLKGNYGINLQ